MSRTLEEIDTALATAEAALSTLTANVAGLAASVSTLTDTVDNLDTNRVLDESVTAAVVEALMDPENGIPDWRWKYEAALALIQGP